VTHTREATLLRGSFSDPDRAREAFNKLMGRGTGAPAEVDVAFYGGSGEYLLVVAAKNRGIEERAARVLEDHGATVWGGSLRDWLAELANVGARGSGRLEQDQAESDVLRRWATALMVPIEHGLLEPGALLALVVASGRVARSGEERRRRLRQADAELREVSERLESALRARHPDLFDRQGRLRPARLSQRLSERVGGKRVLTGDELLALEQERDGQTRRSVSAP
jgi:hypothetical protein